MKYFSTDEESAWAVANTESYHLNEGQDDCENVKLRYKDFNKCNQQERYYDDSLPFHHEGSSTILL